MKGAVKIRRRFEEGVAIQYDGTAESAKTCGLADLSGSQVRGYRDVNGDKIIVDPGSWRVVFAGRSQPPKWVQPHIFDLDYIITEESPTQNLAEEEPAAKGPKCPYCRSDLTYIRRIRLYESQSACPPEGFIRYVCECGVCNSRGPFSAIAGKTREEAASYWDDFNNRFYGEKPT